MYYFFLFRDISCSGGRFVVGLHFLRLGPILLFLAFSFVYSFLLLTL